MEQDGSELIEEVSAIESQDETSGNSEGVKKVDKENKVPEVKKYVRLPLARVKNIMKLDPDCQLISQDAVFITTKAAELFIEMLSKEVIEVTNQTKRKTVMKRDLEKVITAASNLCFLDGVLES